MNEQNTKTEAQGGPAQPSNPNKTLNNQEQISVKGPKLPGVLNFTIGAMGALATVITVGLIIVGAYGFFEISSWKSTKENMEKELAALRGDTAKELATLKGDMEKELAAFKKLEKSAEEFLETSREVVQSWFQGEMEFLRRTVSPTDRKILDLFGQKITWAEAIGISLDYRDYYYRGVSYYHNDLHKLALKDFDKAIQVKPDGAEAWYAKGVTLDCLDHHKEALEAFESAISSKPDYVEAWFSKGVSLHELDRDQEALESYQQAIKLKPDYAQAWYNSACIRPLERQEEALSELKRAIEIDPSFKQTAQKDADFEVFLDNADFKKLVECQTEGSPEETE